MPLRRPHEVESFADEEAEDPRWEFALDPETLSKEEYKKKYRRLEVAKAITGHKTRSVFGRYYMVPPTDQVEVLRKLAELQGATAPARERHGVVVFGDATGERTGGVQAPSATSRRPWRLQRNAKREAELASPTTRNSNRLVAWLREMDGLPVAVGGATA